MTTDERDEIIRELTRHCGDGRLTLDELEERIEEAYAATNDTELRHVLRELPVSKPAAPPPTATAEPTRPSVQLPPLPRIDLPNIELPRPRHVERDRDPEWEKPVGTAFCVLGIILLINGMFWMAMICWFVLPGLVLHSKRG